MVYGDRTEKNVEVIVKKHQIAVESGYTVSWEVLLGNIGVTQTDKCNKFCSILNHRNLIAGSAMKKNGFNYSFLHNMLYRHCSDL